MPKGVSIGKNEAGKFRTAQLKEYPEDFCRALGLTFSDAIDAKYSEGTAWQEFGPEVTGLVEQFVRTSSSAAPEEFGQDYAKVESKAFAWTQLDL